MHIIGKIDITLYSCITADIVADEVIITNERIQHIKEHHPGDFERLAPFLPIVIQEPDYILADKSPNTGLLLKEIRQNDLRIKLVLRLHTSTDPAGFRSSVLSAWIIREKEYQRLIRNKKVLYKRV